jgi:hypothetical protein
MDLKQRVNKVKGLEAVKEQAMRMADEGADALEVRSFVNEGAKRVAYEHPDEDAFLKAAKATFGYKQKRDQGSAF